MTTNLYRWRHLALLISILLVFTISPLLVTFRHGVLILNVIGAMVVLAGGYTLSERKHLFTIAIVLSVISIIATWLLVVSQRHWAVLLAHTCIIVLVFFFAVTILGYVLRSGRVTADRIFAAICVYLLIGYGWAFVYALHDEILPASFAPIAELARNNYIERVMQFRYFSFMTLTTVGYGDILPRSPTARTMAALEAVMGQIYLTVLVARLVGLHIVHSHGSDSRHKD
jgi:hypothetical protein